MVTHLPLPAAYHIGEQRDVGKGVVKEESFLHSAKHHPMRMKGNSMAKIYVNAVKAFIKNISICSIEYRFSKQKYKISPTFSA